MKKLFITIVVIGLLFGSEIFITKNEIKMCNESTTFCEVTLTTDEWQTEHYWYYFDGRHEAVASGFDVTYTSYSETRKGVLIDGELEELPSTENLQKYMALRDNLHTYTDEYFDHSVNVYSFLSKDITHILYEDELIVLADIYQEHFDTWQDQVSYIITTFEYVDSLEVEARYNPQHGASTILGSNKTIDFSVNNGVLDIVVTQTDTDIILTSTDIETYIDQLLDTEKYTVTIVPYTG